MSRVLFFLAVAIVVYLLLRSMRKQTPKQDDSAPAQTEEMVRCAECNVHLPKSEAILVGGNFYCSDAHRRDHTSK